MASIIKLTEIRKNEQGRRLTKKHHRYIDVFEIASVGVSDEKDANTEVVLKNTLTYHVAEEVESIKTVLKDSGHWNILNDS